MRAISPVYPALGRFFDTETQLANAACVSRSQCWQILHGHDGKDFNPQQKKALMANVIARMVTGELDNSEMGLVVQAFRSRADFDLIFKTE